MILRAWLAVLTVFLAVDIAWIVFVLSDFYSARIGHLMRETPAGGAAAVFYIAYTAGIVFLACRPAWHEGKVGPAIANGALLGGLAYGTYTVTNYSLFSDWTMGLVASDIVWGAFLTALCAACGYYAGITARR